MATYNLENLTANELYSRLGSDGVSTRTQILNYLENAGLFPSSGSTVAVESETDGANPVAIPTDPSAQVEIVTSNDIAVTTDANVRAVIDSTPNSLLFVRGTGNVVVTSADGNNSIFLQDSGNDTVFLGTGDNVLDARGSTGNDSLVAGSGNNTLFAGGGHDTLRGGTGHDMISATAGSGSGQLISGSEVGGYNVLGDDSSTAHTLQGGAGADSLYGTGSGNDTFISGSTAVGGGTYIEDRGSGDDSLQGGAGDDHLLEFGTGHDTLHGGTGHNMLSAMPGSGSGELISGSLAGGYNVLGDASSTAHTLQGAAGNDSLYAAGSGNDLLISGSGNTLLDASQSTGNNSLEATGGGNDSLWAGSGSDTLDGSANSGNSAFYSHAGANSTITGGSGIDSFQISNDTIGGAGSNVHTVDVTMGATSAADYVGFQNRDLATDGSLSGPATSGGITTYTLSFSDGQTVNISGTQGSGTTVQLIFTDQTVTKTF